MTHQDKQAEAVQGDGYGEVGWMIRGFREVEERCGYDRDKRANGGDEDMRSRDGGGHANPSQDETARETTSAL